jgi:hypothetical protein
MTTGIVATLDAALAKVQTWDDLTSLIGFAKRAGELALRVKQKAGAMLTEASKDQGGRPQKTPVKLRGVSEYRQMIELWEISESTAQRWQKVAAVPNEVFEGYITNATVEGAEITETGLFSYAKAKTRTVWEKAVDKGTTALVLALRKLIEAVVRRAMKGWIDRGGDKAMAVEVLRRDWVQIGDNVLREISGAPLKWEGPVVEDDGA